MYGDTLTAGQIQEMLLGWQTWGFLLLTSWGSWCELKGCWWLPWEYGRYQVGRWWYWWLEGSVVINVKSVNLKIPNKWSKKTKFIYFSMWNVQQDYDSREILEHEDIVWTVDPNNNSSYIYIYTYILYTMLYEAERTFFTPWRRIWLFRNH